MAALRPRSVHDRPPGIVCRVSGFDRAALSYDRAADIQCIVAQRLIDLTAEVLDGRRAVRILEIGAGTGIYTLQLMRRFSGATITAMDSSDRMLAQLRRKTGGRGVVTVVGDPVGHPLAAGAFDLVTSSCSLQWIPDLASVMNKIAVALSPEGVLTFAMMVCGTHREVRQTLRIVAPHKMAAEELPPESFVLDRVIQAGLQPRQIRVEDTCVEYPDAVTMLRVLHDQGVTCGRYGTRSPGLNRSELGEFIRRYEQLHRRGSGVRLSYRLLYGVCRRSDYGGAQ